MTELRQKVSIDQTDTVLIRSPKDDSYRMRLRQPHVAAHFDLVVSGEQAEELADWLGEAKPARPVVREADDHVRNGQENKEPAVKR